MNLKKIWKFGDKDVDQRSILLRYSIVKHTVYVIVLVVSTGDDSFIMMNMSGNSNKFSNFSRQLFSTLISIGVFDLIMAVVFTVIYAAMHTATINEMKANGTLNVHILVTLVNFFIIMQNCLPAAVLGMLEAAKIIFLWMIHSDKRLEGNVVVNNLDCLETTGSVQILFSDKTGTLTQNRMQFEYLSIRGQPTDISL